MKTIVHIPWSLQPGFIGGTERFAIDLTKGLRSSGHDATIVCSNLEEKLIIEDVPVFGSIPAQYRPMVQQYGSANEHFFRNEVLRAFEPGFCERMSEYVAQQVESLDFDMLHMNSILGAARLPEQLLRRAVITGHECPEEMTNYWNIPYETVRHALCDGNSLAQAGALVTGSRHYAEHFSTELAAPFIAIPLGVQPSAFTRPRRTAVHRPTILLPARFDIRQKGHDIAVRALGILKAQGIHAAMIFSGYQSETYGHNRRIIDTLMAKCDVTDTVTITKFEHRSEAFAAADIVISPERFCSYGLAIAESLAEGIPTVLAPIPTYMEIAAGYPHAHFTADHSPLALANQLRAVIRNGFQRSQFAGEKFQAERSFATTVSKYCDLYAAVLKRAE